MTTPYDAIIQQVANTCNWPFDLLQAQVMVESSGDPYAFRYEPTYFEKYIKPNPDAPGFKYGPLAACSFGLLQVLLETAIEAGFADAPQQLFIPRVGLFWGAKYLQHCLVLSHNDPFAALARYNGSGSAAHLYAERVYQMAGRAA